ncbi:MAG: sel1 repeat family protein [Nitratireductor sp.]|nr:sel1 repeat family protein [Nitratireductor sp.]
MARFDMAGTHYAEMAAADSAEALFELGLIYATGRNCDPDVVSAHKWFNIAAFRGYEAAKMQREELAAEMSREEIAAAQRAAREWLTTH